MSDVDLAREFARELLRCRRCGRQREEHEATSIERCVRYRGPGIFERITAARGLPPWAVPAVRAAVFDALRGPRDDN